MQGDDFLDAISPSSESVKPNIQGDFDCHECRERVFEAYLDYNESVISWQCSSGHISSIKAKL
jgi:hypothetical protein